MTALSRLLSSEQVQVIPDEVTMIQVDIGWLLLSLRFQGDAHEVPERILSFS